MKNHRFQNSALAIISLKTTRKFRRIRNVIKYKIDEPRA